MKYRHLFGPVASRRLGVSLGVDLVVHKVCSLDCVYCECGKTTDLTLERKEWVPFDRVRQELDHYWAHNEDPDYITFSGAGEPCLNSCLGRVIDYIKDTRPGIRVAVLTNASLLAHAGVRRELFRADLVVPSLDAVSQTAFRKINRPCAGLKPEEMVRGITAFKEEFTGRVHLEIFILPGVNDTPKELGLIKAAVSQIGPDRVQLNSLDRPGTCDFIVPAGRERLEEIREYLGPENVDIIARVPRAGKTGERRIGEALERAVLETIRRRPSTCIDLSDMLGAAPEDVQALLDRLTQGGSVISRTQDRGVFYQTVKREGQDQ
ncbi:MAG: radical SAM protein [Desulfobacter sp.]|nr:MAG: radical SAM protein [Desulfobacter sp.]